jgi:hypothetical protein
MPTISMNSPALSVYSQLMSRSACWAANGFERASQTHWFPGFVDVTRSQNGTRIAVESSTWKGTTAGVMNSDGGSSTVSDTASPQVRVRRSHFVESASAVGAATAIRTVASRAVRNILVMRASFESPPSTRRYALGTTRTTR